MKHQLQSDFGSYIFFKEKRFSSIKFISISNYEKIFLHILRRYFSSSLNRFAIIIGESVNVI